MNELTYLTESLTVNTI